MKRNIIGLILVTLCMSMKAQSDEFNVSEVYDAAIVAFKEAKDSLNVGNVAKAMRILVSIREGNGEAIHKISYVEGENINAWIDKCCDKLDSINLRGYNLYKNKNYMHAIQTYDSVCNVNKETKLLEEIQSNLRLKYIIAGAYNVSGICYGAENKLEKAISCYEVAMTYDLPVAYFNMATVLKRSKLKNPTPYKMHELYERTAKSGDVRAMDSTAVEYDKIGKINEAARWVRQSALKNSNYGKMLISYYNIFKFEQLNSGNRLYADVIIKYLKEASSDNDSQISSNAKCFLGYIYINGECGNETISSDVEKGKDLIRESAYAGNQIAKKILRGL